ncbi:ubiquitin carboxyl-terminal hydrolase 4-like [Bradysia coprophila]|uniref:ubiquitin carboxyl-terminal hydrolase 4-like n=1 Tax=Bradysia coprophila TaxID=38358 RepID=UPI00187D7ED5|nr:ubiquitin carboxyl-terminal hydrolase 4-like [Bradysia coprophila]XP_037034269.1 ubiquitin carboxyl-terminal hydrolase 4-like [Bradysia coprophila]
MATSMKNPIRNQFKNRKVNLAGDTTKRKKVLSSSLNRENITRPTQANKKNSPLKKRLKTCEIHEHHNLPKASHNSDENSYNQRKQITSSMATLCNIGNTCYLNSIVYTLRFAPRFLHNLHHVCDNLLEITPRTNLQITTEKLHELYTHLYRNEVGESTEAFHTETFLNAVQDVSSIFEGNQQQDAHEFLMCVLDIIRETCNSLTKVVTECPDIVANGFVDFFTENFEGITCSSTKCLSCETITEQKETMIDLSVPITSYKNIDQQEDPNLFIQNLCITREQLRGENKYRCEECTGLTEAIRTVSYPKLPRLLIIQLKRFSGGKKKINNYIPTPFNLQCFCSKCCTLSEAEKHHSYRLYSVITHVGATISGGHYIAYTTSLDLTNGIDNTVSNGSISCQSVSCCDFLMKNCPGTSLSRYSSISEHLRHNSYINNPSNSSLNDNSEPLWFKCDDDKIKTMTQREFEDLLKKGKTITPYLLFYARVDLR